MPKIHVSNVCRANIGPEVHYLVREPGKILIPDGVMAPRQIKIKETQEPIEATLKWHRDHFVPTIGRTAASNLVRSGEATYEPQYLLVYSMDDYLADPDVRKDEPEWDRARQAQQFGIELVVVAVIGESRSTQSVCRNIVSGCQSVKTLVDDAAGALEASNVFLIED